MTEELSFIRDSLTQMLENDRQEDELIKVRQNFNSINDIRQAAIRYARRHKFAVSTLRSGARQLVLVCKHSGAYRATKSKTATPNDSPPAAAPEEPSNEAQASTEATAADPSHEAASKKNTRKKLSQKIQCPFEIRAKPMGSSWIIYKVNYEHNHEMAADIKAYAQHRKLTPETRQLIIDLMNSGSTNSTIMEYLQLKGIDNVLKKDIANIRQAHFNSKSKKADSSGAFPSTLQTTTQDTKPDLPSCASTTRSAAVAAAAAAAAVASSTPTDNMDPSSTTSTNMTTDTTTTNQPQQKDDQQQQSAAEGDQLYQFISQNNVQVN
ncbi:unnamed protein product [Mucor fragilis]